MDKKDLQQIKDIFSEGFASVWEHNIEPAFSEMNKRISDMDKRIFDLSDKNSILSNRIDQLPTMAYLDNKFIDLETTLSAKLQKEDKKVDRLVAILTHKKILSPSENSELASFQVL